MAKSRYAANKTLFDSTRSEPIHYATWAPPASKQGYEPDDLLEGQVIVEHTWEFGDRLDRLAYKHLGDDAYWWMIAYANRIVYPLGIRVGTVLRIPTSSRAILEKLGLV